MKEQYFSLLPREAQKLVQSIEATMGREIIVEKTPDDASLADPRIGQFTTLIIDANEARIWLRTSTVPLRSLVHEILHISRHWLEGSWSMQADLSILPRLTPAQQSLVKNWILMLTFLMRPWNTYFG